MKSTTDVYIELVQAINATECSEDHSIASARQDGFTMALKHFGWTDDRLGYLIINADIFYMDRGEDRPMCGGVFLDWEPKKEVSA